ncbi:hypothetical protein D9758_016698 [Tetrapyrgos nigripes]|uniref:Uncharacterized protein n=1 Tax=Tetrapyrgos nigripes TaxID=182062 RepID=A0A8H5C6I1_9AGAR|nr:hypothetical protein D9758_016698 [Tetrapyrgos nigripes]
MRDSRKTPARVRSLVESCEAKWLQIWAWAFAMLKHWSQVGNEPMTEGGKDFQAKLFVVFEEVVSMPYRLFNNPHLFTLYRRFPPLICLKADTEGPIRGAPLLVVEETLPILIRCHNILRHASQYSKILATRNNIADTDVRLREQQVEFLQYTLTPINFAIKEHGAPTMAIALRGDILQTMVYAGPLIRYDQTRPNTPRTGEDLERTRFCHSQGIPKSVDCVAPDVKFPSAVPRIFKIGTGRSMTTIRNATDRAHEAGVLKLILTNVDEEFRIWSKERYFVSGTTGGGRVA